MFGSPNDIEGQCNEHLYIGDDYGDNSSTMRCQLPKGHEGPHREIFQRESSGEVTITWERGERCWHKWVKNDSKEALDYYIELYEDKDEGTQAFELEINSKWPGDRCVCILCGKLSWMEE